MLDGYFVPSSYPSRLCYSTTANDWPTSFASTKEVSHTDDVRVIVTRTQDEIKRMVIEGKFTPIMKPRFIQRRQQVGFQEI